MIDKNLGGQKFTTTLSSTSFLVHINSVFFLLQQGTMLKTPTYATTMEAAQVFSNGIKNFDSKKASRQHSNTTLFGQSKSNAVMTHCTFTTNIHPKFPMIAMEHKIAVKVCALRRRRSNTGTDTYVLMEPGKEEMFVTEDELRDKLKGWLDNWPNETLPLDLARFDDTDAAVSYLVTSVCELEIDGDVGSIQWYEVRLE